MARPRKQSDLDQAIADILSTLAPQIAVAVREYLGRLVGGGAAPATAPSSTMRRISTGKTKKYNNPTHCIAPGCSKKHGGPRSGFFCEDHQKLSVTAKNKIKTDRKASKSAGGSRRATASKPGRKANATSAKKTVKRKLTAAGRKSLSDKMKARWAAKKKSAKKD